MTGGRRSPGRFARLLSMLVAIVVAAGTALYGPLSSAQALPIMQRLLAAPVPGMCGYPAGRLIDGHLPGTAPGNVDLDLARTRVGKLIKGRASGAAAVFSCSQGGVGWPEHVVFYDSGTKVIGHFDSGSIGVASGRAKVARVTISKRVVTIRLLAIGQPGDNDLWGSAGAKVTYAYDRHKKRMTRRSATVYRESSTARKLLSLVRGNKLRQARTLAAADVVNGLRDLVVEDSKSRRKWVTFDGCAGPFSDSVPAWIDLGYGQRGCYYTIHRRDAATGDDYASVFLTVFDHPADDAYWTRWHGEEWFGVAG